MNGNLLERARNFVVRAKVTGETAESLRDRQQLAADLEAAREALSPEGPREHVANALTSLDTYRQVHGGGWSEALHEPTVSIAELSSLLEHVEARLRLALGQ